MRTYQLIQSGIIQMEFQLVEDIFEIKCRDIMTGEFTPYRAMEDADFTYLSTYLRTDAEQLFLKLLILQEKNFSWQQTPYITSWDAVYEKEGSCWVERKVKFPVDIWTVEDHFKGFILANAQVVSFLLEKDCKPSPVLSQWFDTIGAEIKPYGIKVEENTMIPMRDGIKLATDILFPQVKEKMGSYPVILARTPYGKEGTRAEHYRFVQHGYIVVLQDVRGRNLSEGDLYMPKYFDTDDGSDTLDWIASQPWCDGNIGMIGASYGGYVQWAAASSGNKHLKAIVSIVTAGSPFVDLPRKGGTICSGGFALNFGLASKVFDRDKLIRDDWEELLKIRPLEQIAVEGLGYPIPFFNEQIKHVSYDAFWQKADWHSRKDNIAVPAMVVSGWYDDNYGGTAEALDVISTYPKGNYKVILGPWLHKGNSNRDISGISVGNTAIRHDLDLQYFRWLDHFLKGKANGIAEEPAVDYYTVGQNEWKQVEKWPLQNIEKTPLYLSTSGHANTDLTSGKLVGEPLSETRYDCFTYNPDEPAPHLIDISENELSAPDDYFEVILRDDIVTYTTPTFAEDKVISGTFAVDFHASSSAVDTDWVVRVCEVTATGQVIKLADGFLCAKFREDVTAPTLLTPEQIYLFMIETSRVSAMIKKGHALQLMITSSAAEYIFPHTNTELGCNGVEKIIATQKIFSGMSYPSKIVVPFETKI